jgi:hypothetical protein
MGNHRLYPAGDGKQRPLVPRFRCLPRLTPGVRRIILRGDTRTADMKELLISITIMGLIAGCVFFALVQAGVPHTVAMPGVTIPMGLVPTLSQTLRERNRITAARTGAKPIDDLYSFGIHPALVALYGFLIFIAVRNLLVLLGSAAHKPSSSKLYLGIIYLFLLVLTVRWAGRRCRGSWRVGLSTIMLTYLFSGVMNSIMGIVSRRNFLS